MKVVWGSLKERPEWTHSASSLLRSQTSLHLIAARPPSRSLFFSFSQTGHSGITPSRSGTSLRKQYWNKSTKTRLPLERREQHSHSGYDTRLLNYIKPRRSPHSAGMSPLTQADFMTLPSHCPGDTGGQNPAVTPWGICQTHLLDAHCERGITSLSDVTGHCVAAFLCLGTKREREKKTIWIPSLKRSACVLLFCVRGSALLDGGDSCRFGKSSF